MWSAYKKCFFILLVFLFVLSCRRDDPGDVTLSQNDTTGVDTTSHRDTIKVNSDSITQAGVNYIYAIEALPVIVLSVSTAEWNRFLSDFDLNPDNEEYVHSAFRFKKNTQYIRLNDIGLRLRGNISRRRPEGKTGEPHSTTNPDWHHASFSLNFNKFVKGQKMAGVEKINLKWFKDDATYAREVYCYDLFKRYGVWTAPGSSYCRLRIIIKEDNDTINYGVYQMVEPVDKEYLKNRLARFGDADGFLWKANYGADLMSVQPSLMDTEHVTLYTTYTPVYDLKTSTRNLTTARVQLSSFISNLNALSGDEFRVWIESVMDVSLFLKTYAVSVMCGMWDDYWCNKNNYYFYFTSTGKFYFIPYDYDNTLGTSFILSDAGRQDVYSWGNSSYPLINKILKIPTYKAMYTAYLKELASSDNDYFYADRSIIRIRNWQSMIQKYISNDTGEDMVLEDKPASWGNCSFYRLLDSQNNFFRIKSSSLPQ